MLQRLLLGRSLVFRLWLAVNLIFLAAAFIGTALYVWTSVQDQIDQAQEEVAVRDQSMRVFSSMALRVLQSEGTFSFTDEDFEMLRNIGVYRIDLFNDGRIPILRIDPWSEDVQISPAYLSYIQTIPAGSERLVDGVPVALPPRTHLVPSIAASPPSPEQLAQVHQAGLIRTTVAVSGSGEETSMRPASMTPVAVLKGTDFGEELWVSRPGQVQQSFFAIRDLTQSSRMLVLNASLVMLMVFLATSAGWWALLHYLIYRPLLHFSQIARLIADGEPLRMPTTGSGEMAGLATAINEMADALESRATIDSLTGLYNHRHLTVELDRLVTVAQQTKEPLGVLVADLNDFKQINDTFGHTAGDKVLCEVAAVLVEWADGKYVCWRLGGDEFAAAMPGISKGRGRFEAARLQKMIQERGISVPGGAAHTSVSVGIACSPADGLSARELLSVADTAMYLRKDIHRGSETLARSA